LFYVRHGEPVKREGTVGLKDCESGSAIYRPERHGLVIYNTRLGELRVHADSEAELELFRLTFGLHLFRDGDYFPASSHKFTLEPLRQGRKALAWAGIPGVRGVTLVGIDLAAGSEPRGFWKTLEAFAEANPPAAVMASWRLYMGPEFETGEGFLRATARLAQGYPCLSETGCGDGHEVVALDDGRWVARSQEDRRYCRGILLTDADIVVHELDPERLGGELCRVLGFEPAAGSGAREEAPKLWPVATHPETRSPVYLALCPMGVA
jgi:hypothetical protein